MNWHNKNVMITGGLGFIGSHLTKRLSEEGASVVIVDNYSTGDPKKTSHLSPKVYNSDVQNINSLKLSAAEYPDFLFHLGAPSSDVLFRKNPPECISQTINGFNQVTKFANENKVKKFIFATSSSVYGFSPPPQSESTPCNPSNLYGVSKLMCEKIADAFLETKHVGLRFFAGYGPGEDTKGEIASVITIFMKQIIDNSNIVLFGDGSQSRDFVYVDDIVESLIKSAEMNVEGIINVGSGKSSSFNYILDLLEERLQKKVTRSFVSKPLGYFDSTCADLTKLRSTLGMETLSLEEGISRYITQLSKNQ